MWFSISLNFSFTLFFGEMHKLTVSTSQLIFSIVISLVKVGLNLKCLVKIVVESYENNLNMSAVTNQTSFSLVVFLRIIKLINYLLHYLFS